MLFMLFSCPTNAELARYEYVAESPLPSEADASREALS
jgi:hypothetical protein